MPPMALEEACAILRSTGVTPWQLELYDAATIQRSAAMVPVKQCSFCNERFRGYGHSPSPLLEGEDDVACAECNLAIVHPARRRSALRARSQ